VAGGEWESLAGLVIIPALEQAAAELNERTGLVAEVSEHPFDDACILWIGRHEPASPFLSPHGSFAIHDEPVLPMIRVEEADPRISAGRPVVQVYLRRAEVSVSSIKAMVLAFADRLPAVEQHDGADARGGRCRAAGSRGRNLDFCRASDARADRVWTKIAGKADRAAGAPKALAYRIV
jgi:hypothetical protein